MTPKRPFSALVIGAGPSGLTTIKHLRQRGIDAIAIDRASGIGGNWNIESPHSSVYESAHLISSKRMTQFADFPMPDDYPAYPGHRQVLDYLKAYAEHFQLAPHIRLNTSVKSLRKTGEGWHAELESSHSTDPSSQHFDQVVIANGHHAVPFEPALEGEFQGEKWHSHFYKHHRQLEGRKVLVVGAGNSGCDIAVEAAIHGAKAAISMRRGYHFFPKFIRGKPADVVGDRLRRWPLPRFLQHAISRLVVDWTVGRPQRYGLPQPKHGLFEAHPIINSQLPYYAGHGKLTVFPDVRRFDGSQVEFTDGRRETFDLVILATGYQVTFPFMDPSLLNTQAGIPQLYLHAFHPTDDTLFVAGMIQPNSGQWPLVELQAELIARFLEACGKGSPKADWFRGQKQEAGVGVASSDHFLSTPRHRLEVDYFGYRKTLRKLLRRMA